LAALRPSLCAHQDPGGKERCRFGKIVRVNEEPARPAAPGRAPGLDAALGAVGPRLHALRRRRETTLASLSAAYTALGRGAQRLRCRASYEQARGSDFAKLAKLSAEGRSSAMSLVMASIVRTLRTWEGDLDDRARKLLAFVDNRQDAPLQIMTGHISSPPLQMEARR
jgi:hypothetical protein